MEVKIESSWKEALAGEFGQPYFEGLVSFVKDEYKSATVYPPPKFMFRAFELCPFNMVKVVILGQDPYINKGEANGLSFAVPEGMKIPPSLRNIFREIESDLGEPVKNNNGDLERWAKQGVLLLNATLTVRARKSASHQNKGWEQFTDAVIQTLSEKREHIVFILGNYARGKKALIDWTKHEIIESPHPSPFSAYNGFFGSKPFSKTNEYLIEHSETPIQWL